MRVLVIGGTGFIGQHVVRRLVARGHEVTVLHRGGQEAALPDSVKHVHSELGALSEHREIECDTAIHMYALTAKDGTDFVRLFGGRAGKLLLVSSGDVYRAYGRLFRIEPGACEPMPLTEDSPVRTVLHPYPTHPDYDKIPIEREVMRTGRGCVLRLAAVYGIGGKSHRIAPWLKRMETGHSEFLIGEKYAAWRWTHGYVENVAEAIALAAVDRRSTGRVYNVGEEQTPPMLERVRRVAALHGWKGRVVTVPDGELPDDLKLPYDLDRHMAMDSTRIRAELGYREVVPEAEGWARTVRWEAEIVRGQCGP